MLLECGEGTFPIVTSSFAYVATLPKVEQKAIDGSVANHPK
jgi:hypothetical protein